MSLTLVSCVLTSVICYGIVYFVIWHMRRRRFYELASKFGGPPVLPFIGNAHIFIGNSERLMSKIQELSELYTPPFRVWLGPRLFVYLVDPEQVKAICVNPKALGRGEVGDCGRPLFGTGLFSAPVTKWQVHRKLIQPTFNAKILDTFVEIFFAQSKILTEQMERNLDGPEFKIFNLVSACTLDMICETAMGVKIGAQENRNFEYVEALQKVIAAFCERFFHFWLHPDFVFYRTQLGKDQQKHIKYLHGFTDNVIKMKKIELQNRGSGSKADDDQSDPTGSSPRREVFLDHLMKLTDGNVNLTDEALRDEVNVMVVTGYDTSAITLTNVMLMLASHPEVQEKVYQELCEIYGDDDIHERPVAPKDLPRMKYLERVLKETMRLFPIAPLIARELTDDVNIGGHTLPKGSSAIIGILRLHRNEKYWPDPLKFDPDRFLPEETAKRHPYAFMGFSGGPRNCIGFNYALMSMKTLIATLLRCYILKKDNILEVKDIRLRVEVLLKTADPVELRIEKRIRN